MSADWLNKFWRPAGAWGVVGNVVILPGVFVAMAWFSKGVEHIPALIGLYTILAGLFGALFGIRQMGKNQRVEASKEIRIAQIQDDDDEPVIPQRYPPEGR